MHEEAQSQLSKNGYTIIRSFFDLNDEIIPIQESIYKLTLQVAKRHNIPVDIKPFDPDTFDHIYDQILHFDRAIAGEVYDLVKQLPPFLRLVTGKKSEDIFCLLRDTDEPGIGAGSYGIRIDNPSETKFQSHWHQEFFYQPQSLDGLVFWTPLVKITQGLGPVKILDSSHKNGMCNYAKNDKYQFKSGSYQYGIHQEEKTIKKYELSQPLSAPGDLILMDFLTIHASGDNLTERSRWSIQYRFFNHCDKIGQKIGWKASITAGSEVQKIFPENFIGELN